MNKPNESVYIKLIQFFFINKALIFPFSLPAIDLYEDNVISLDLSENQMNLCFLFNVFTFLHIFSKK